MAKTKKKKMVFLGITIEPNLRDMVHQYADDHGLNASLVVRQALKSFLPMRYFNDEKGILRENK
jgi:hypothetical protein